MGMPKSSDVTIQEVIKYIDDGDYRIPRFQRDFVWDIKKSTELIDSIFRGFPIGSIIVWKTKTELNDIRNLGGVEIPGKDTGRYTSYIIDGQQRLTSLYFALKGLKTENGTDFSSLCLYLKAADTEQFTYESIPKDANSDDYILLKDMIDTNNLCEPNLKDKVEKYNTLFQYKISVIEIDDEKLGLDEVVEIFERINLGGKKLNLFSIIAARSYRPGSDTEEKFDLSEKFLKFNEYLTQKNYGEIYDSVFLQIIAGCLIDKVNKADILRYLKSDLIIDNYSSIEKATKEAIQHLKGSNYGVLVANLLPYQRILVLFTYFHYKQKTKPITSQQEQYLQDYFWRCVLGKRFNSSADTNTNTDIVKIQKILDGQIPSQEGITLTPRSIFESGRFTISSAYVIGMLCLMAQKNPQSFGIGKTIDITNASVSNTSKKQYHHFFPTNSEVILNNKAYKEIVNNVVNIVFMDATTNSQISNKNPSIYVSEFANENPNLDFAFDTHFISLNGYGIEDDNFYEFINARSKAMYAKLCSFIVPCEHDIIKDTIAIEKRF